MLRLARLGSLPWGAALLAVALLGCTNGSISGASSVDGGDSGADDGATGAGSTSSGPLVPPKDAGDGDADAAREPTTSPCLSVAHIGDSLTYYTQDALTLAYSTSGVMVQINAFGGRAILQKLPDDPMTGKEAAESIRASGFDGCWVVALGTNDTANVAAGAGYSRAEAIDAMMAAIDESRVAQIMWVNTYTTKSSGYWSNANMVLWNEALEQAKSRWSNMVVFDWAAQAAMGMAPFSDGIHHTSAGYDVRNAALVAALLAFFSAR